MNLLRNHILLENKEPLIFWISWMSLFVAALTGQVLNFFHLSASYHIFADDNNFCGIHNGLNVLSNLSFLLVGFITCMHYIKNKITNINLWIIAIGAILVCFGSSYYHYMPGDYRLLWDRLPMSLVFSGMLMYCVIKLDLVPFIKNKVQFSILYLFFSIICVLAWYIGSLYSINILGPYVFLQFGGMILMCYMGYVSYVKNEKLLYYKIIGVITLYVLAKIFETYDDSIFMLTESIVSGHTIKHLISALALYLWLKCKEF